MMTKSLIAALLLATAALLCGCGGSGPDDDDDGTVKKTPRVDCVARPELCK